MQFSDLAQQWWDPNGPMRPLHALNPQRLTYITQQCGDLAGKTILDIGCGGGIVCEPLARLGANVTGADLSAELVDTARQHAAQQGLAIKYIRTNIADITDMFDVVLALEVVEHVDNPREFIGHAAKRLKPGGTMILSTLNRTIKSYALGKIAAEYIIRWVPVGTHDWNMFLKPHELVAHCEAAGLKAIDLCGLRYHPVGDRFSLDKGDLDVNYFLTCSKEG